MMAMLASAVKKEDGYQQQFEGGNVDDDFKTVEDI